MSKLLCFVAVYLLIGTAYAYDLNEEASNVLKAEEQRAIQKKNTAYSYLAKKHNELPTYSSEELKTKATRTLVGVVGSSAVFVVIGLCVFDPNSR